MAAAAATPPPAPAPAPNNRIQALVRLGLPQDMAEAALAQVERASARQNAPPGLQQQQGRTYNPHHLCWGSSRSALMDNTTFRAQMDMLPPEMQWVQHFPEHVNAIAARVSSGEWYADDAPVDPTATYWVSNPASRVMVRGRQLPHGQKGVGIPSHLRWIEALGNIDLLARAHRDWVQKIEIKPTDPGVEIKKGMSALRSPYNPWGAPDHNAQNMHFAMLAANRQDALCRANIQQVPRPISLNGCNPASAASQIYADYQHEGEHPECFFCNYDTKQVRTLTCTNGEHAGHNICRQCHIHWGYKECSICKNGNEVTAWDTAPIVPDGPEHRARQDARRARESCEMAHQ